MCAISRSTRSRSSGWMKDSSLLARAGERALGEAVHALGLRRPRRRESFECPTPTSRARQLPSTARASPRSRATARYSSSRHRARSPSRRTAGCARSRARCGARAPGRAQMSLGPRKCPDSAETMVIVPTALSSIIIGAMTYDRSESARSRSRLSGSGTPAMIMSSVISPA